MTDSAKPVEGPVLSRVGKHVQKVGDAATSLDAIGAINNLVDAARTYGLLREEHQTKRAAIQAYSSLERQRIAAAESVIKDYFRETFAERAKLVDDLLERFDAAAKTGDSGLATSALSALVDVARSSPLAHLQDLSHIRSALNDPDKTWDL